MRIKMIGTVRSDGTIGPYELDIPREFWRYLFAGLAMSAHQSHDIEARLAVQASTDAADLLLAELENGGGS